VIIINHGVKVFDNTLANLQLNLGEKKIVELTLDQPFDTAAALSESVRVLEQKSPLELTLEVDASRIAIGDFIKFLSSKVTFSDIAVKELPMEEIITHIYRETKTMDA
jgi:ABC-2 type transport system ATP-binding protein